MVTGWDEARDWLRENATDWQFQSSESKLVPGRFVGAPTTEHYEVRLSRSVPADLDFLPEYEQTLIGYGETILAAIQDAVGGIRG